jgi:DNA-binding SARP family transcriptional activator
LQHGGAQSWTQALDSLINDLADGLGGDVVLILDDYHAVDELPDIRALVERMISLRPPQLHLVLATRLQPQVASLPALRARGELLEIGERELAFTPDEIGLLFSTAYEHNLDAEEVQALNQQTGGWPIALQLVWQSFVDQASPLHSSSLLEGQGREALFAYLAREVLARQPAGVQDFLLRTSILSEPRADACDYILGVANAAKQLEKLHGQGLFLAALGGGLYRYHPLFHQFLRERAALLPDWKSLHARAAAYYRKAGAGEEVLYHVLAIGDIEGAVQEAQRLAVHWLENGRYVTLLTWLDQLPQEALKAHPGLLIARGDAARLLGRYEIAEEAYQGAFTIYEARSDAVGQAQAVRGEALIYADTMQPKRAETLLRQALRLLPAGEEAARAEVLRLILETWVTEGKADRAMRVLGLRPIQADCTKDKDKDGQLRITHYALRSAALVRLGRLAEAGAQLTEYLAGDGEAVDGGRPSATRCEAMLLLSVVGVLEGDAEGALRHALEALDTAHLLGSAMLEVQAHIRAGHAMQLAHPDDDRASMEHYLQALMLADAACVPAAKAEAFLGMALLHGFRGNVTAAQDAAREGLRLTGESGDEWMAAQLWTALGIVATAVPPSQQGSTSQGKASLLEALSRQRVCKNPYGETVIKLWLSVGEHRAGNGASAGRLALETFNLAQKHGCDGLLVEPTLFGPRDRMMLVPVLLAAREAPAWRDAAQALLRRGFPAIATDLEPGRAAASYHPGVTLRIQTLGPLRVWRGNEEIGPHEWQRKKAQQLLALLITNRERWLLREQICDWLWPDETLEDAEVQFKVTLNGLNAALEPMRPPRTPPFYIHRHGSAYRFFPPEGIWLDVAEFEARLSAARLALRRRAHADPEPGAGVAPGDSYYDELTRAVELYHGEYLSDWLYEDWSRDERERIQNLYKEAATLLARGMVERSELYEAIRLCDAVLALDPAWEDSYGVLMRAYAGQGNRRMVQATYERCVRNLREYLDMEPLPATTQIYKSYLSPQ